MSTDAAILTTVLLAMIAALVAIRLTFRNSVSVRDALFTPTVFAICGALIAISIGMIWLADHGRVTIDKGAMLVVVGTCLGAWIGAGARNVYARLPRGKTTAFILVMMLVAASIGAPMGWIAGDVGARNGYEAEELSSRRMIWGMVIGSGVGFLMGLSEVLFRRRGVT